MSPSQLPGATFAKAEDVKHDACPKTHISTHLEHSWICLLNQGQRRCQISSLNTVPDVLTSLELPGWAISTSLQAYEQTVHMQRSSQG